MNRSLHIAQDTFGYWFLSAEKEDGTFELLAHQITSLKQLHEHARDLADQCDLPHEDIIVETPHRNPPMTEQERPEYYSEPQPRKAATHVL